MTIARPTFGPLFAPRDPHVPAVDVPRLTGQNAAILAMLEQGPRTNVELAAVTARYGARIWDTRKYLLAEGRGRRITTVPLGDGSGLVTYTLVRAKAPDT